MIIGFGFASFPSAIRRLRRKANAFSLASFASKIRYKASCSCSFLFPSLQQSIKIMIKVTIAKAAEPPIPYNLIIDSFDVSMNALI